MTATKDKYIWRENDSTPKKDCATLYEGPNKICTVYKKNGLWQLELYRIGNLYTSLGDDFESIKEAEQAAVRYLRAYCVNHVEWYLNIKEHLPELDDECCAERANWYLDVKEHLPEINDI